MNTCLIKKSLTRSTWCSKMPIPSCQLVTAVIVGYYGMLVAHFSLASVFTSVQPDFRCNIDGSGNFNQSAFAEAYPDGDFCLIKQSFCEDYQTRDCALFTGESIGSEENLKVWIKYLYYYFW